MHKQKQQKPQQQKQQQLPLKVNELKQWMEAEINEPSLKFSVYQHHSKKIAVFYISYMVDSKEIESALLQPLLESTSAWTSDSILNELPLSEGTQTDKLEDAILKVIKGEVFIYIEDENKMTSFPLIKKEKRSLGKPENETVILGPQTAFSTSLTTNLNIIRSNSSVQSSDLRMEKFTIGKRDQREVRLIYLKSLANPTDVNTMQQRLNELDIDVLEDSMILQQYIEDSSTSVFPQFIATELPDRFDFSIMQGRIGLLVAGSPMSIIAPATFFSFFESTEDLYQRWNIGSFLRVLRYISFIISLLLTPLYVASISFHHELIPTALMYTLGQSRVAVPFSPMLEVLFLESMIELLRESSVRLPTKVGQTMGIVGGVVVGTAAVQAGVTSNVLVIFVALSALASFTIPNYVMGSSLRLIRFPMIVLAGLLGLIGVVVGICFLTIHLLKLTSLGRSYLVPIYPLRLRDFNKVFFRLPASRQNKRFTGYRPKDILRFRKKDARAKLDIDE